MTDYSKVTNFTAKDNLASGDASKRINGALFDSEFNPISTAIASKIDKVAGEAGQVAQFTSSGGIESTNILIANLWPVGSIYINAAAGTNPATLIGIGTWEAFGAGRVLVGLDSSNTIFDEVEETGGSADSVVVQHNHDITDPGHIHSVSGTANSQQDDRQGNETTKLPGTLNTESAVTGISIDNEGESGTNKNLQPYITVYMWKRTA